MKSADRHKFKVAVKNADRHRFKVIVQDTDQHKVEVTSKEDRPRAQLQGDRGANRAREVEVNRE